MPIMVMAASFDQMAEISDSVVRCYRSPEAIRPQREQAAISRERVPTRIEADARSSRVSWKSIKFPGVSKLEAIDIRKINSAPRASVEQKENVRRVWGSLLLRIYSITSSARTSSEVGTVRPSALAAFRFINNSNLDSR
jgi:hypothetical protein